ncbi:hypothetical protein [Pseudoalteromonas sp. R3]|uniref:hypothetical protein n=1 Tax=Pseudoalteromonas sp. R3 TaxID=1709477 RepID=UPI0006B4D14F|nr:hypothetical protein [Pseudoalteromonas sp. R3]AZZ98252.1 hypothetical protein ELR70_14690 [Pseudoalteromonas sp. R3]
MKLKLLEQLKNAQIDMPLDFEFGGLAFKFTAQIKLITQSEIDEITSGNLSDADVVRKLLVGWTGFTYEGEDAPYSEGAKEEMLAYGALAARLSSASIQAQYAVQEKN